MYQNYFVNSKVIPVFLVNVLRDIYTSTLVQLAYRKSYSNMWTPSWLVVELFNQ